MKTSNWLSLCFLVMLIACSTEDAVRVNPNSAGNPDYSIQEPQSSAGRTQTQTQTQTTTTLKLKKVASSVMNAGSLATLKKQRPGVYSQLTIQGNVLKSNDKFTLYSNQDITLLVGADDIRGGLPPETTIVISGYERLPIDVIGNLVLWAVCQCAQGGDDCQFNDIGAYLGACTGNLCMECKSHLEVEGPEGIIYEVQPVN